MNFAERGASKWFRMYGGRYPISRDEFVSSAYEGLVVAARKFDATRGCKFSTMAFQWINHRLGRTVMYWKRQNGWTFSALGENTKGIGGMEKLLWMDQWPEREGKDGDVDVFDPPAPLPSPEDERTVEQRARVLATASTHRDVVILNGLLDGRSQEDIGRTLGLSRGRIQQLADIAIQRAKDMCSTPPETR